MNFDVNPLTVQNSLRYIPECSKDGTVFTVFMLSARSENIKGKIL
jgi:hypothetical protein